ncbi:Uncharacterised protein [Jonesia denitrificans]|nr:Uncharacterised protein [Jonesia denitrificans]
MAQAGVCARQVRCSEANGVRTPLAGQVARHLPAAEVAEPSVDARIRL